MGDGCRFCSLVVKCWVSIDLEYARLRLFDVSECMRGV